MRTRWRRACASFLLPDSQSSSLSRALRLGSEQPCRQEREGDQDQGPTGRLLRSLPESLADAGAEPETELGRRERLDGDPDHGADDRESEQAGAEPDRQLVHADAQAEVDDGQASGVGQQAQPPLVSASSWAGLRSRRPATNRNTIPP